MLVKRPRKGDSKVRGLYEPYIHTLFLSRTGAATGSWGRRTSVVEGGTDCEFWAFRLGASDV